MKKNQDSNYIQIFRNYGLAAIIFANPLLYMVVGGIIVDIRNLFGANLDRRISEFNTDEPFIQAMGLIFFAGLVSSIIAFFLSRRGNN